MAQSRRPASPTPTAQSPAAVRQLGVLASHADQLDEILKQTQSLQPGIDMGDVAKQLSARVKITEAEARNLFVAIDQLRSMAKNLGGPEQAIDRVVEIFGKENVPDLLQKRDKISK